MVSTASLNPSPRKEMRLHQQPRQIRVPDRFAHPRVEARRRPEDHVVVVDRDPGDESGPGLVADVSSFEERGHVAYLLRCRVHDMELPSAASSVEMDTNTRSWPCFS